MTAILVWLLRGPGSRLKQLTAVGLLSLLVVGYFLVQPGQSNRADGPAATTIIDQTDRPVLVEAYSNY
ncbi:MAG: hypothetical protein R3300_15055 [Candidatus Promineifilaceae bacterium]|nr:hypothetical protein [Candidatus Promineifilaceae bacterium]